MNKTAPKEPLSSQDKPKIDNSNFGKKNRHNLSLSDTAWSGLKEEASHRKMSVSQLNEEIGLGKIKLESPEEKDNSKLQQNEATNLGKNQVASLEESNISDFLKIPIYPRLKGLIKKPIAVFGSIMAFVWRTAKQFDLYEQLDSEVNKDFVCDVIKQAIEIVFYVGYIYPNKYINNPSALIRLAAYWILNNKCQLDSKSNDCESLLLDDEQKTLILWKTYDAYAKLNSASRSVNFEALKMKSLDQMTLLQICTILNLQGAQVDEEEVRVMIKQGLSTLRSFSELEPNDVPEYNIPDSVKDIEKYWKLASHFFLQTSEKREELEKLLLLTQDHTCFDFWVNEIDYHIGETLFDSPNENYRSEQEYIRNRIENEIDAHLIDKKKKIDRELAFCRGLDDMRNTLLKCIKEEVGIEKEEELKILLGEKL